MENDGQVGVDGTMVCEAVSCKMSLALEMKFSSSNCRDTDGRILLDKGRLCEGGVWRRLWQVTIKEP